MTDFAAPPQEQAAPRPNRRLSWGATVPLLFLVAVIAASVVFAVTALRQQADEAQHQQLVLTRIRLRASELSTLAARTLEVGRLSTVAEEQYRLLSNELRMLTAEARQSPLLRQAFGRAGVENSVRADIEAATFSAAIEDEFAWLRMGRLDDAREVDDLRVGPGYDALSTTIDAALIAFDARAARIVRGASVGTALLSLFGLAAIVALLLGSARQQARRARSEQETLLGANEALREENERRRQTEEALALARNKAEEMARLKDVFLASMSHEIRTPLMAILGYSELLREQAPPDLREYADQIEAGGHRLLDTLTSVLDYAKIEAGQMEPSFTVVDAAHVARGVESELRGLAARKHLTLRIDAPATPVHVRGDSGFVHRALYNLASNAIKFTEQGEVTLVVRYEGGGVALIVRDTGPGISEAFLPHLFEEFRQESAGERRRHEGSGLGLAITRRLVECMNGTVDVQSRLGAGATFTVRLPVAHDLGAAQKPPQGDGAMHRTASAGLAAMVVDERFPVAHAAHVPSLLLLEDNPTSAGAIGLMLQNFQVDHAASYDEAIAKVRAGRYDLFLLDINLRESRTGVDALASIRNLPRYAATPAIALTAYALPGDEERFLQAGFDRYLSKPFRKAELQDAIAALLSDARTFTNDAPSLAPPAFDVRPGAIPSAFA